MFYTVFISASLSDYNTNKCADEKEKDLYVYKLIRKHVKGVRFTPI